MPTLDAAVVPQFRDHLSAELVEVIIATPLPPLQAGPLQTELAQSIREVKPPLPPLMACGMWLLCGDLNASHEISQAIESPDGSFWHGIMHRREGDFPNAKYWFRRVGQHPVLLKLAVTNYGQAAAFVDRCEIAIHTNSGDILPCEELQWLEWQYLMAHLLRR